MEGALPLRKRFLDRADEADVFVDYDAKGEDILHGLAGVEFLYSELQISQCI